MDTGVARDLARRVWQHREGLGGGFTRRYGLTRLVWCEHHDTIVGEIQREKTVKHWPRAWTVRLIHAINPQWNDLYETIGSGPFECGIGCNEAEARHCVI